LAAQNIGYRLPAASHADWRSRTLLTGRPARQDAVLPRRMTTTALGLGVCHNHNYYVIIIVIEILESTTNISAVNTLLILSTFLTLQLSELLESIQLNHEHTHDHPVYIHVTEVKKTLNVMNLS